MSKAFRIINLILCFVFILSIPVSADDTVFDDTINIVEAQPTFSGADVDTNVFGDLKAEGPVSFTEIEDARLRHKADILYNLGFMSCYPDGTFRPDVSITKGDFICSILSIMNFEYEQSAEDPYTNAVKLAYDLGIVVGDENNRVNPDEYLSYTDACTMLIRILGYESYAVYNGGYPYGYLTVANNIGIHAASGEQLTRADACNIFYSVLNVPLLKKIMYGEMEQYDTVDNITVLSCYHDMYMIKERVNSTYISALLGYETTSKSVITIGDLAFCVNEKDYCELLGYYVEAYYTDIDGVRNIVYITKHADLEEIIINADDVESFSNLKYKYHDGDKLRSRVVSKHHTLINNGIVADVYNDDDFIPENGVIKLLSYKGYDCDVVITESFYPFALDSVNTDPAGNPQFLSKYSLPLYKVDLNSDAKFSIYVNDRKCSFYSRAIHTYDPDGNAIVQYQIPSIPTDCIVNIFADKYESVNGVYMPAKDAKIVTFKIYTDRAVEGEVEAKSDGELTINGKNHEIAKYNLFDKNPDKPELNSKGRFLLDYDGKICAFISDSDILELEYAYMIYAVLDMDKLNEKVVAKLLLTSGEIKTFDVDEEVKINGTKVTDGVSVMNLLKKSAGYINDSLDFNISQLIKFKCNSAGEIFEIETVLQSVGIPDNAAKNHIHREAERTKYASRSENSYSLYFKSGTYTDMLAYNGKPGLHFRVPKTETFDDAHYSVSSSWGINTSEKLLDVYNCNYNLVPDVIVEYSDVDPKLDYPYVLVESVGRGIDEKGIEVGVLECITGNVNTGWLLQDGKATYYAYDTSLFDGLECGDFICLYGTGNYISNFDILMPISTVKTFDMSAMPLPAEDSQKYDLYELYAIWENYHFILQRGPVIDGTAKREYQQINYFNKLVDYGGFVYDCTGREPKVSALYSINAFDTALNSGNDKAARVYIWESTTVTKYVVVYIGI